jgi:DNA-nicking Smr family endonuclease
MSRRRLSDEEEALWSGVARSVKPLRPAKPAVKTPVAKPPLARVERTKTRSPATVVRAAPPANPLPLSSFDRRLKQRVARGREAIDARIDLHGMTQSEAHIALARFLRRAQADGARIVLIVTGKGASARGTGGERGVLKRQVPLWLALPEFRPLIVAFEHAHVSHGGEGALYVRLRRPR